MTKILERLAWSKSETVIFCLSDYFLFPQFIITLSVRARCERFSFIFSMMMLKGTGSDFLFFSLTHFLFFFSLTDYEISKFLSIVVVVVVVVVVVIIQKKTKLWFSALAYLFALITCHVDTGNFYFLSPHFMFVVTIKFIFETEKVKENNSLVDVSWAFLKQNFCYFRGWISRFLFSPSKQTDNIHFHLALFLLVPQWKFHKGSHFAKKRRKKNVLGFRKRNWTFCVFFFLSFSELKICRIFVRFECLLHSSHIWTRHENYSEKRKNVLWSQGKVQFGVVCCLRCDCFSIDFKLWQNNFKEKMWRVGNESFNRKCE